MEKDQATQRGFGLPGLCPGGLRLAERQHQSDCQLHRQEDRNGGAEAGAGVTSAEDQTAEATELGQWVALEIYSIERLLNQVGTFCFNVLNAAMWSGVRPQHPPTICRRFKTHSLAYRLNSEGGITSSNCQFGDLK